MGTLKRADCSIHFKQAGSHGPCVIFIQGIGVTGGGWRPQITELSRSCQTLAFDNRGIGQSPCQDPISIEAMASDVLALMDAVSWDSAHVVGHSMGGVIAQQVALDAPKRVRSLSLLCTFARGKDAARLTLWTLWMTLRTRVGPRPMRRRAFLEMLFPKAFLNGKDLDSYAEEVGRLVGRDLADSPPVLMKQLMAMSRHDVSGRHAELAGIPTLVISVQHDCIARPAYGRQLAGGIPGATFEEFPEASHGVVISHAAQINARLAEFIRFAERNV